MPAGRRATTTMNMVASHWSASPLVLSACAAVAVVHLRGMHAAAADARRQGRGRPAGEAWQGVVFYLGLLAVVVALASPVGYWAQRYIWIRSVQDVLLAMAAPGLVVLGAPWLMLARGVGRGPGRDLAGEPASGAGGGPEARAVGAGAGRAGDPRRPGLMTWPVGVAVALRCARWRSDVPALSGSCLGD